MQRFNFQLLAGWAQRCLNIRVGAAVVLGMSAVLCAAQDAGSPSIRIALIDDFSGASAHSGPIALRNLSFAVERVNAQGGVKLDSGESRKLTFRRYDAKSRTVDALDAFRAAITDGAQVILQGVSPDAASALIEESRRYHKSRDARRVLMTSYGDVPPLRDGERCNYWNFNFQASVPSRVTTLLSALAGDRTVRKAYLLAPNSQYGQSVLREVKRQLSETRPDIQIVGDSLSPMGISGALAFEHRRIVRSGAQVVVVGESGDEFLKLMERTQQAGFGGTFYFLQSSKTSRIATSSGMRYITISDWQPEGRSQRAQSLISSYQQRYKDADEAEFNFRIHSIVLAVVNGMQSAKTDHPESLADKLETMNSEVNSSARMHAATHQMQLPVSARASLATGRSDRSLGLSNSVSKPQPMATPSSTVCDKG